MSVSKLAKEIGKLIGEEGTRLPTPINPKETLISDSKGRFIQKEITEKYYGEIRILSKSGTTVDDFGFRRQFLTNIRIARNPLVLVRHMRTNFQKWQIH